MLRGTSAGCLDGIRKQLQGTLTPALSRREREEEGGPLTEGEGGRRGARPEVEGGGLLEGEGE